jgi:hypothetical protein
MTTDTTQLNASVSRPQDVRHLGNAPTDREGVDAWLCAGRAVEQERHALALGLQNLPLARGGRPGCPLPDADTRRHVCADDANRAPCQVARGHDPPRRRIMQISLRIGTDLNGRRVLTREAVFDGDTIQVCERMLRYRLRGADEFARESGERGSSGEGGRARRRATYSRAEYRGDRSGSGRSALSRVVLTVDMDLADFGGGVS